MLVTLVLFLLSPLVVSGQDPSAAEEQILARVKSYAETLFAGDLEKLATFHDAQMKSAMTEANATALTTRLQEQFGEVVEVRRPWKESGAQGFDRYRVPIEMARRVMDLRVVVNGESQVAGLFLVEHSDPPPDYDEPVPGTEIEVEIGAEVEAAQSLPGTLLIPEGQGPFPAAVFLHGSGPHDRNETIGPNQPFRDLAYGLAKDGVASLRYDKRSHHDPKSLLELGDRMTVEDEVILDARRAIELLRSRPEIDPDRIYVVGHSLGGTVAPRVPDDTTPVAGLVLLAAATRGLPEMVVEQSRYIAGLSPEMGEQQKQQLAELERQMTTVRKALDGEIEPPKGFLMGAPIGYYRDLEAHPPAKLLAEAKRPVMILQGGRDYQVTEEDYSAFEKLLYGKEFVCMTIYDDLDHLFMKGSGPSKPADYQEARRVPSVVSEDIAAWILDRTCPELPVPPEGG